MATLIISMGLDAATRNGCAAGINAGEKDLHAEFALGRHRRVRASVLSRLPFDVSVVSFPLFGMA